MAILGLLRNQEHKNARSGPLLWLRFPSFFGAENVSFSIGILPKTQPFYTRDVGTSQEPFFQTCLFLFFSFFLGDVENLFFPYRTQVSSWTGRSWKKSSHLISANMWWTLAHPYMPRNEAAQPSTHLHMSTFFSHLIFSIPRQALLTQKKD